MNIDELRSFVAALPTNDYDKTNQYAQMLRTHLSLSLNSGQYDESDIDELTKLIDRKLKLASTTFQLPLYERQSLEKRLTNFERNRVSALRQIAFLSQRHPNDCLVSGVDKSAPLEWITYKGQDGQYSGYIQYNMSFHKITENLCKNKRIIFIPLSLKQSKTTVGHANALIYDTVSNTIDRFEPHGDQSPEEYAPDQLDIEIQKFFPGVKYFPPAETCPVAFQALQEYEVHKKTHGQSTGEITGFCQAWSFWYADLRLTYPDMDRKELAYRAYDLLEKRPGTLTDYIVDYGIFFDTLKDHDLNNDESLTKLIKYYTS